MSEIPSCFGLKNGAKCETCEHERLCVYTYTNFVPRTEIAAIRKKVEELLSHE